MLQFRKSMVISKIFVLSANDFICQCIFVIKMSKYEKISI